ncbi:hypothetical protein ACIA8G_13785 [Lentzea sp. NPDC051213]|uniref:hypothetical protein n=1 Tax=Lentzea sp. NPDC051213 TaxID=3364126 RepID=UPI00379D747E
MNYRLLSQEACKGKQTCPSVWVADTDPDHVVIVGALVPTGTVPSGPDEVAVRLRRSTIVDAGLA